jgi:hypothetical protein
MFRETSAKQSRCKIERERVCDRLRTALTRHFDDGAFIRVGAAGRAQLAKALGCDRTCPLGAQMIAIARIQNGLTDILQSQNLRRQPLETDREPSVWRHAELEHPQMILEGRGLETAAAK